MQAVLAGAIGLGIIGVVLGTAVTHSAHAQDNHRRFDRVVVIVMENHRFDQEIGTRRTPFITQLATTYGLETYYFGVTHPSLPNYLAMIGGDQFGIHDNHQSCFDPSHPMACHIVDAPNLIDQLEEKNISWEGLFESMPSVGFLGFSDDNELYVQHHNPFVYFRNIALSPSRLANLKPFALSQLQTELDNPESASRFIYIVPNQCSQQHGKTKSCRTDDLAQVAGDAFLSQTVPAIIKSPSFTEHSALFIVWDEDDYSSELGCCGLSGRGGGHVPALVITKNGKPIKGVTPSDHYSLLATIEDGFDLPRLANARKAATLFDVFPDASYQN